jgi:hypothetical protein
MGMATSVYAGKWLGLNKFRPFVRHTLPLALPLQ